jgi:hypothetical protein
MSAEIITLRETPPALHQAQNAIYRALKTLAREAMQADDGGNEFVAILFTAVAEACDVVFYPKEDERLVADFAGILKMVRSARPMVKTQGSA